MDDFDIKIKFTIENSEKEFLKTATYKVKNCNSYEEAQDKLLAFLDNDLYLNEVIEIESILDELSNKSISKDDDFDIRKTN